MLSLFVTMHFNLVTDPPQVRYSKLTETIALIHGCAFWSHKDSELAVILFIQLSPFEWQCGLTYKATPCRSNHIAIQTDSFGLIG